MHFGLFVFAISTSWSRTAQSALPDGGDDGKPERIFLPRSAAHQSPTYDGLAPHIDYYPSNAQTATAVLICPGGGYRMLSWEKEGVEPARFYASSGLDAFVLSYRLRSPHPAPYDDANSALEIIRARQPRYAHIGIIGELNLRWQFLYVIHSIYAQTDSQGLAPEVTLLLS